MRDTLNELYHVSYFLDSIVFLKSKQSSFEDDYVA